MDPFDFRREEWVDTLHRWFDHWLLGVDNGIMDEPQVDIEMAKDTFATFADWPVPDDGRRRRVPARHDAGTAGGLGLSSGGDTDTLTWLDAPGRARPR